MTLALTNSLVTFTSAIKDLLNDNADDLGLKAVFYGDQTNIPTTPVACVEPVLKNNNLNEGASSRLLNPMLEVVVYVYHSVVGESQNTRLECDLFAEAVEALINAQINFDGLVIHSYVVTLESGYVVKSSNTFCAAKLTVQAITRFIMPS